MNFSRPLALLRFAVASHDLPLAGALARALGPVADAELRAMPRLPPGRRRGAVLGAALELVAGGG